MGDTAWMDRAACAGVDPELFYPERGGVADTREAREVCAGCPVAEDCLMHAVVTGEKQGIWGGLTEKERRSVRRRVKAAARA